MISKRLSLVECKTMKTIHYKSQFYRTSRMTYHLTPPSDGNIRYPGLFLETKSFFIFPKNDHLLVVWCEFPLFPTWVYWCNCHFHFQQHSAAHVYLAIREPVEKKLTILTPWNVHTFFPGSRIYSKNIYCITIYSCKLIYMVPKYWTSGSWRLIKDPC